MRRVVKFVALFACAVASQLLQPVQFRAAAEPVDVSMVQVIRPLTCTVDIVHDGPVVSVRLMPATCTHSPAARQLLATTAESFRTND